MDLSVGAHSHGRTLSWCDLTSDGPDEPSPAGPLHFHEESRAGGTHVNLSAVRRDGEHLWVAGDETATVERLTAHTRDGVMTS